MTSTGAVRKPTANAGVHLSHEELVAHAAGERPGGPVAAGVHVSTCPACAATVARYRLAREVVAADAQAGPPAPLLARAKGLFARGRRPGPAPPTLRKNLRRVVAALGFDSRTAPALAGLRTAAGAETPYQLAFESEAGDVDLEVDPPAAGELAYRVTGQFVPPEALAEAEIRLVPVVRGGRPLTVAADEHGLFVLETPPGRYHLEVRLPTEGALLVLPDLAFGPGASAPT